MIRTTGTDLCFMRKKKKYMEESRPGALTTRKRETCCWPAACFQADMGNMSSKSKRRKWWQRENTKNNKAHLTIVEAVSCQRKPVQSSKKENVYRYKNQP